MPVTTVERQTEDTVLREGLKHMFGLISIILTGAARAPFEDFMSLEDENVDLFLTGLRTNGYEIVRINRDETS